MKHNVWFIADTHFGHRNIIKYCNRPFSSIEEHDEILMQNWNNTVKGGDTIYHLGDFGFINSDRIIGRLHGNINLIKGNHDNEFVTKHKRFNLVKDVHSIKKYGYHFFLSHYAHRTWSKIRHGGIHLYGHSHGNLPDFGRSTDVGVDVWNYIPVSIDQIIEKMKDIDPIENGITIKQGENENDS